MDRVKRIDEAGKVDSRVVLVLGLGLGFGAIFGVGWGSVLTLSLLPHPCFFVKNLTPGIFLL